MNKKNWGVDEINLPTKRRVAAITRKELENRAESTAKKKKIMSWCKMLSARFELAIFRVSGERIDQLSHESEVLSHFVAHWYESCIMYQAIMVT